jgi:NodT family efflux transporter outer membrane factor (OMF) lipoprotein
MKLATSGRSAQNGLLASSALLLLAGCMVGPKYVRPAAPLAPSFKEAPPAAFKAVGGWKTAQPQAALPRGKWWEMFHDAQLNALEEQIDSANQTLKIAAANFRAARDAVRYSRAAEAPTIGTSPSISSEHLSANRPYALQFNNTGSAGDFTLPFDLSYEVDLWGRIRRTVTAAREQAQASAADMETARLSLHAELAMDYIELRSADAQEQLLRDSEKAYADSLQLTQTRYEGGIAPESDVSQAQTQLAAVRVQETDIQVQRQQYEHAIAVLIGKPPAGLTIPATPLNTRPPVLPGIPGLLPSQLLERRPDIASKERTVAAANEQIGIAESAWYPTLGLGAAAGLEGSSALNWFNWPSRFWAVGPMLSETLFDAGRRRATTDIARANYDATVADYRQTVLTAFQQVEDNLSGLRVLETEARQQHQATASAAQSLNLSNTRYEGGVDDYLQVITWQTALLIYQRNDIDIERRRLEASVLLIKALGGGWSTAQLPTL